MSTSHDIKLGELYTCEVCGLSLEVVKQGKHYGIDNVDVAAGDSHCDECGGVYQFGITCCGTNLKKGGA